MYNLDETNTEMAKTKNKIIKTAAVSKVDVEAKDGGSVTEEEWNFCTLKVGTYFYFFEGGHLLFFGGGHLPARATPPGRGDQGGKLLPA